MINRLLNKHKNKKAEEKGFTLIELLVVITILGILAAIVIISLGGLGDRGKAAAASSDAETLRTAEEAYCNANGSYGTVAQLRGTGTSNTNFLANQPKYNGVVLLAGSPCGNSANSTAGAYTLGPTTFNGTTGPQFLSAANNTGADSFMTTDFIAKNNPIQFDFDSTGNLKKAAVLAGNQASLFLGADQATATSLVGVDQGGTCGTAGSSATPTQACPGLGTTLADYATGTVVVFSCRADSITLQSAAGVTSPSCPGGSGGLLLPAQSPQLTGTSSKVSTAPTTPAQVAALLTACGTCKVAIADPRITKVNTTGSDNGTPAAGDTYPVLGTSGSTTTAPYGAAAYEALTSTATGGGALTVGTLADTCAVGTTCSFLGYLNNGQIMYGSNVTTTQALVENGTADVGFVPLSFVQSPLGNDTNSWTTVAQSATMYDPIHQYGVVLAFNRNGYNPGSPTNITAGDLAIASAFQTYMASATGIAVLNAFGYSVP